MANSSAIPSPSPSGPAVPAAAQHDQTQLDLLKLEYTQAAERYENIYKAIWQSFYYLAVLSAAILTFGSQQLALWLAMLLAGLPMLFWYYVQFLPLDRYAKGVIKRLAAIEEIFNGLYFTPLISVGNLPPPQPQPGSFEVRINHYIRAATTADTGAMRKYPIRKALFVSAWIAIPLWSFFILAAFRKQLPNNDWLLASKTATPIPVRIVTDPEQNSPIPTPQPSLTPKPIPPSQTPTESHQPPSSSLISRPIEALKSPAPPVPARQ